MSHPRVQELVVTTPTAAVSIARSRADTPASSADAFSPAGAWPSGMCTSTTRRSRPDSGASTSGTADAINPSSSTTAPSGSAAITRVKRSRLGPSGLGHGPVTACSCIDQPSTARPAQIRRS